MDIKKQKAFNARMGKRQKYSKGGMVRRMGDRKYFAVGGPTVTTGTGSTNGTGGIGQLTKPPASVTSQVPQPFQSIGNDFTNVVTSPFQSLQDSNTNKFQAQGAPLQAGTGADQLNAAYGAAQSGINQQQNFVNALNTQNGIGNENQAAQGYSDIAAGRGPNVAQNMLNQSTAQNVANQGALMAGQRGASSNPALIARQAAMQGAATQQQAAGQSATLQSQQQQNALSGLGNIGTTQVNQQGQGLSGLNTATQNEQNTLQGANTAFNNANVGMQGNLNSTNAGVSQGNQSASTNLIGGGISGIAGLLAYKGGLIDGKKVVATTVHSDGSVTHHYAEGGPVQTNFANGNYTPIQSESGVSVGSGGGSSAPDIGASYVKAGKDAGEALNSGKKESSAAGLTGGSGHAMDASASMPMAQGGPVSHEDYRGHFERYFSGGGKVPAMVSPGEIYLSPDKVKGVIENGDNPLKSGDLIGGKAKVKGDSRKNDTVPADLEEGGVVIPRHIMKFRDPEKAELFVRRAVHMKRASK